MREKRRIYDRTQIGVALFELSCRLFAAMPAGESRERAEAIIDSAADHVRSYPERYTWEPYEATFYDLSCMLEWAERTKSLLEQVVVAAKDFLLEEEREVFADFMSPADAIERLKKVVES